MIIIQGMVGAGKSTLAKLLSVREQMPLYPEPVSENPYLEKYYENPSQYAFQMQVFLLHSRFEQHLEAQKMGGNCIMDMSLWGNDIFASLQHHHRQMTWTDYQNYSRLSKTLKSLIDKPDLMVYLKCTPRVSVQRIMKRNRMAEMQASIQYWRDLYTFYEKWYDKYEDSKKICIDVDHVDVVRQEDDEDYILDMIMESL